MRVLGAVLLIAGCGIAVGYLLYWLFSAVAEFIPVALKAAIVAAVVGLVLLILSFIRERIKASKEEDFEEVDR